MATTYPSAVFYPGQTSYPGDTFEGGRRTFEPPTEDVPFRMERGLFGVLKHGLTVWRVDGQWFTSYMPDESVMLADRFYGGGRIHEIDADEYADLVAGGFGPYITEEN